MDDNFNNQANQPQQPYGGQPGQPQQPYGDQNVYQQPYGGQPGQPQQPYGDQNVYQQPYVAQQPYGQNPYVQSAPQNQGQPPKPPKKKSKTGLIIGIIVGVIAFIAIVTVVIVIIIANLVKKSINESSTVVDDYDYEYDYDYDDYDDEYDYDYDDDDDYDDTDDDTDDESVKTDDSKDSSLDGASAGEIDFHNTEFTLNGVKYRFPVSYSDLAANGTINEDGLDSTIDANTYLLSTTYKIDGYDNSIYVGFKNFTNSEKALKDCNIWKIEVDSNYGYDEDVDFVLSNGITLGVTTYDEVLSIMGTPDSQYDSEDSDYRTLSYEDDDGAYSNDIEFRFYDGEVISAIEISNYDED